MVATRSRLKAGEVICRTLGSQVFVPKSEQLLSASWASDHVTIHHEKH